MGLEGPSWRCLCTLPGEYDSCLRDEGEEGRITMGREVEKGVELVLAGGAGAKQQACSREFWRRGGGNEVKWTVEADVFLAGNTLFGHRDCV